jgi:hypothetical protein
LIADHTAAGDCHPRRTVPEHDRQLGIAHAGRDREGEREYQTRSIRSLVVEDDLQGRAKRVASGQPTRQLILGLWDHCIWCSSTSHNWSGLARAATAGTATTGTDSRRRVAGIAGISIAVEGNATVGVGINVITAIIAQTTAVHSDVARTPTIIQINTVENIGIRSDTSEGDGLVRNGVETVAFISVVPSCITITEDAVVNFDVAETSSIFQISAVTNVVIRPDTGQADISRGEGFETIASVSVVLS